MGNTCVKKQKKPNIKFGKTDNVFLSFYRFSILEKKSHPLIFTDLKKIAHFYC